ncbi:tRNA N(3)-methylcytidine methyltransferase METTL6 isoform X3 [Artibeus jamaicensis]|uniref:tRNA N(3)-methylcytidine methyltransferase METTL6 isoform X3 n=1 Tax=Artibeus jamaicensis TaxID=9417 RepID=UPI00235AE4BC|nr:tRNA N(3)-methylcytidine methyltransferase METTL6 isoform X3 [Artibeus jamaicensis]
MTSLQRKGLQGRILSSEEEEKLKRDQVLVSDFKQQQLEKDAQKNWDLFYKRNSTNFFKDRHWTTREFEELRSCREFEDQKLTVLEAGCGVGNCLFPLLEEDLNIFAYACDFSPRAVEYVKQNPLYDTQRCKVFQCDLTEEDLLEHVPPESVDVVMLIFVLSAVHPEKMHLVLRNIHKTQMTSGNPAAHRGGTQVQVCVTQKARMRHLLSESVCFTKGEESIQQVEKVNVRY